MWVPGRVSLEDASRTTTAVQTIGFEAVLSAGEMLWTRDASPSSLQAPPPTRTNLATAAIVGIAGGIIGGVILLASLVWCWRMWGRQIKKSRAAQKKENEDLLTTKRNTRRNTENLSNPRFKPMFGSPPSRPQSRVTFATDLNEKNMASSSTTPPPPIHALPRVTLQPLMTPSRPRPLLPVSERAGRISGISPLRAVYTASRTPSPKLEQVPPARVREVYPAPGGRLPRKKSSASTISSGGSWYSARSTVGTHRQSGGRLSQVSSASAYSQFSDGGHRMPIGQAF